jgi:beta-phosphoglucomutase-like phosphatase (HAD superfamily)
VSSPPLKSREPFLFDEAGLVELPATSCGGFAAGRGGVARVLATGDRKVEFICFDGGRVLAHVRSAMGYPAYYPLQPASIERPVAAVLMDLDGTSVHSEAFWIWVIERTTARLAGNPKFALEEADLPFVSGHSVSEHLQYCIAKYAPRASLEAARGHYFEITHREMKEILEGRGRADAFRPAPGLKEFLLELKGRGIKIGLVTSGLHEKAWPEIVAAFRQLSMGDPREFYDAIISAGFPLRKGEVGTLGELEPKPHPWLYAETARVGLGIDCAERSRVIGIEDSGAGVVAIRLAGFACIGMEGGNIRESGTAGLCSGMCGGFGDVLKAIR